MSLKTALEKFVELIYPFLPPEEKTAVFVVETIILSFIKAKNKTSPEKFYTPQIKPILDKSDDEILFFFKKHKDLKNSFSKEIEENNIEKLKKYFKYLYPLYELEDDYMKVLSEGLKNPKDIIFIVEKNRKRLREIAKKIARNEKVKESANLLIKSLGNELFDNKKLRETLIEIVEKK